MRKTVGLFLFLLLFLFSLSVSAEVSVQADRDTLPAGEFLTIRVLAPENAVGCSYIMILNGKKYFETKESGHFDGVWCARKPGNYVLKVKVRMPDKKVETAETSITVTDEVTDPDRNTGIGPETVFHQKDGWWKGFPYGSGTLNKSGCAIFTLSHALLRMGFTDSSVLPQNLAVTYKYCHVQGGTSNSMLIGNAAKAYGFCTVDDAIESPGEIRMLLDDGCMFSFSIVLGHIALIDGISEDGTKVHITDSAPGATIERIKNGFMYLQADDGSWTVIEDLDTVPGMVWYPETETYGGLSYWMDLSYVARRGVRLIQPAWLQYHFPEDASAAPAELKQAGCVLSEIIVNGEKKTVRTRDLFWKHETDSLMLAKVTASGSVRLLDPEGEKTVKVTSGTMLPVVAKEKDRYLVRYNQLYYYLPSRDGEAVSVMMNDCPEGIVAINGKVSSSGEISVRNKPDGKVLEKWRTGTSVAILDESGDSYLVEGRGKQAWILKKYVLLNDTEP